MNKQNMFRQGCGRFPGHGLALLLGAARLFPRTSRHPSLGLLSVSPASVRGFGLIISLPGESSSWAVDHLGPSSLCGHPGAERWEMGVWSGGLQLPVFPCSSFCWSFPGSSFTSNITWRSRQVRAGAFRAVIPGQPWGGAMLLGAWFACRGCASEI